MASGFDDHPLSDPASARPPAAPVMASDRDRRTRSYDALERPYQGRWVRVAKYALPAFILVLLVVAVAWPTLFPQPRWGAPKVKLHDVELPPGNDVRMVGPRYAGTDAKGRPFLITAQRALQDANNENMVHLHDLQADLTFDRDVWLSALAPSGLYDTDKQTLELRDGADIYSNKGYEMHTPQVRLDLKNNLAEGEHGVEGHGPLGRMRAERYRFEQNKRHLTLSGGVHVTYYQGFYR